MQSGVRGFKVECRDWNPCGRRAIGGRKAGGRSMFRSVLAWLMGKMSTDLVPQEENESRSLMMDLLVLIRSMEIK